MRASRLPLFAKVRSFALIFFFHLMQPAARLWGRIKHGLTPWRRRNAALTAPGGTVATLWSENWRASNVWLNDLERELEKTGAIAGRGGDYDDWDLSVRGGLFAGARLTMGVEDHARGTQNLRFRTRFQATPLFRGLNCVAAALTVGTAFGGFWPAALVTAGIWAGLAAYARMEWHISAGQIGAALDALKRRGPYFETEAPSAPIGAGDIVLEMHAAAE
jgi:hypothetical protein